MTSNAGYPADYRRAETDAIRTAVRSGDCVSLVGLSGAGKSNLLAHLVSSQTAHGQAILLTDGNRLREITADALLMLLLESVAPAPAEAPGNVLTAVEAVLHRRLSSLEGSLCLVMDLSMPFSRCPELAANPALNANLRALRDAFKYRLTYVLATRHTLPPHTELSELCYAHTLWLGPLAECDAKWTVARFAERRQIEITPETAEALISLTRGYPAFLRAACEAFAAGAAPELESLAAHPAVRKRLEEFHADNPTADEIRESGLEGLPLLVHSRSPEVDTNQLTAKELLLLEYLQDHAGEICAKDDLIRAVWPEDKILERGVRDDSLAQLVRRLREKVEADPSNPKRIQTVPGRGYRYKKEE